MSKNSTLAPPKTIQNLQASRIQSSESQGFQPLHVPKIEEETFSPNMQNAILSPHTSDGFSLETRQRVAKGFAVGTEGEYGNHSLLGSPGKAGDKPMHSLAQQIRV